MKLSVFFLLFFTFTATAGLNAQQEKVTLDLKGVTLDVFFQEVQKQTGVSFVYNEEVCRQFGPISVKAVSDNISNVLEQVFADRNFSYRFNDKIIIVSERNADRLQNPQAPQAKMREVKGKVVDDKGNPLPGVGIIIEGTQLGTTTDVDGNYRINCPDKEGVALVFSFVGMKKMKEVVGNRTEISVKLVPETTEMEEVVITGIYQRKKESFTGSTTTFKKDDLKMVGAQNLVQSLKTLDPSFVIMENNEYGSDPNRLPDIEIRGKSSIVGLKEKYDTDPNQPLFILDGFETDLKTVIDLNMDRVQSVTLLKDAASTALYGSKAANGVVVIETKQPEAGTFRVSYNGNFSLSIPDLTDYNLMNAAEKLEFEKKAGYYDVPDYQEQDHQKQLFMDSLYNKHKLAVMRGVNTYWLSEPLRVAFVQRHNIYAEGGDKAVRYGLGVTYNGNQGIMKQSGNDLVGANFDLIYRKGTLRFYNKMSFDYSKQENPTVQFSEYARANPYFEKRDKNGKARRYLEQYTAYGMQYNNLENPLYNASLNSYDQKHQINFNNKLNVEWRPVGSVMIRGRLGIGKTVGKGEKFISPEHSSFDKSAPDRKGSFTSRYSDTWFYDGDFTATYGHLFNGVHQLNAVLGTNFRSTETKNEGYRAFGFPVGNFTKPSFASGFGENTKPSYSESETRSNSFYFNFGYAYDNRYLLDANIRIDGASVFGSNKRYTETWAFGLAWNAHNENFLRDLEWVDMLKIRASVGNPGNQNFSAYQAFTTYSFNNWITNNFGASVTIDAFGNPNLKWQKTIDRNIGADLAFFNNRFNLNFDYYQKTTDPLLALISVPSSVGTKSVATNMGEQWTKGYSGTVRFSPVYKLEERINWSLNFNFRHQTSEYKNIGNSLDQFNKQNKNHNLERYYDGGSPTTLWSVRSMGIDPSSGKEVFMKKDGTYSFKYDAEDEVAVGNSEPDLEGIIGTTLYYKGFSFSMNLRYSFGGDIFNHALYTKVENVDFKYNQDKRALYDRWQEPGQHSRFKGIRERKTTPISSRFVQTENFLKGESFSLSYDVPKEKITRLGISALRLQANMNDIFRISSVKRERGIEYPFARMVSASVSATF